LSRLARERMARAPKINAVAKDLDVPGVGSGAQVIVRNIAPVIRHEHGDVVGIACVFLTDVPHLNHQAAVHAPRVANNAPHHMRRRGRVAGRGRGPG
jgi:hypothetical protein